MILEVETYDAFGYYPMDLKPKSDKLILAACDECGTVRIIPKSGYCMLCKSCAHIRQKHTKEQDIYQRARMQGNKIALGSKRTVGQNTVRSVRMKDSTHSEETKARMSIARKGKYTGRNSPNYKYGKRIAKAKSQAKRKRDLGYTILIPLAEGDVGHHITDEYVIGIPKRVHEKFSGISRKNHRALIYEWLKVNDKQKYELYCLITGGDI